MKLCFRSTRNPTIQDCLQLCQIFATYWKQEPGKKRSTVRLHDTTEPPRHPVVFHFPLQVKPTPENSMRNPVPWLGWAYEAERRKDTLCNASVQQKVMPKQQSSIYKIVLHSDFEARQWHELKRTSRAWLFLRVSIFSKVLAANTRSWIPNMRSQRQNGGMVNHCTSGTNQIINKREKWPQMFARKHQIYWDTVFIPSHMS